MPSYSRLCKLIPFLVLLFFTPAVGQSVKDRTQILSLIRRYYQESYDVVTGKTFVEVETGPDRSQEKFVPWADQEKLLKRYFAEEIIEGQRFEWLRREAGLTAIGMQDCRYPESSVGSIGGPIKHLKISLHKQGKDHAQVRVVALDHTVGSSWISTEYWLVKRKGLWRIADQSLDGFFKGSPRLERREEIRLKHIARLFIEHYQKVAFYHLLHWWATGESIKVSPGETDEGFSIWSKPYKPLLEKPPIRPQASKALRTDRHLYVFDLLKEDRRDTFKEAILRIKAWDQCPPEFKTLPGDWNEPGTGKGGTRTLEELYRDWKRITWEYSPLAKQQATEKK